MCGIFGYVGRGDAVQVVLKGLHQLAYRGYDSAGIAGLCEHQLKICRSTGRLNMLESRVEQENLELDLAIAHTRWATHGVPTEKNAHPHCDTAHKLAIVHNGIIENYALLRAQLELKGVIFRSDTDSEVIAHLIALFYKGDLVIAVQQTANILKGAWAIAVVHSEHSDEIVATANEMSLIVGIDEEDFFISSDIHSLLNCTRKCIFLEKGEIAHLTRSSPLRTYNSAAEPILKEIKDLNYEMEGSSKGSFEHYTLKEIFEQPQTIYSALKLRFSKESATAQLNELCFEADELLDIERILILGCGTSWNAGYVAAYMIEELARISVQVEIASEFRYKNPIVLQRTLVIAISQSGETADTLAAVKELKAKGARVIGLCNSASSTLARAADHCILLRAGLEIGVCSTKAFTSQVIVLSLLTLLLARTRHMDKHEGIKFLEALLQLPQHVQSILNMSDKIAAIAKKYSCYRNFFFLGRQYMYPTSLEGALKLKEIAYVNANGYPAGEMKHGPIALIDAECPTIALCANALTYDKMVSNLMEVKARSGKVLAFATEGSAQIAELADDVIWLPKTLDCLAVVPTTVATQLFAYHLAHALGIDIDHPRNLAKSVTVE